MTHRPKKHIFIVELTDMEMGYSSRRVRQIVEDALDHGLYIHGHGVYFENVRVKVKRHVDAGLKSQGAHT